MSEQTGNTDGRLPDRFGKARLFEGTRDAVERFGQRLGVAPPDEVPSLVEELIRLGRRARGKEAWEYLARGFDRLDQETREYVLVAGNEDWGGACQSMTHSASPVLRLSAARIAGVSDVPEAIAQLSLLIGDDEPSVGDAAAGAMVHQTRRATSGVGVLPATRGAIEACVMRGVDGFDRHRRVEPIWCALELLGTPARARAASVELRKWIASDEHVAHLGARGLIKKSGGKDASLKVSRAIAWLHLTTASVGPACADRVLDNWAAAEQGELLSVAHLLGNGMRRARWRECVASRAQAALSVFADERFIQPEAGPGAHRCAGLLAGAGTQGAWNAGVGLLADERPLVRYGLVRELIGLERGGGPVDVLLDAALDQSDRTALSALRAAHVRLGKDRAGREALVRLCRVLERSGNPRVRELAAIILPAHDPWATAFSESRLLARRLVRADRDGSVTSIRRRLIEGTPEIKIATIRLSSSLGLLPEIEFELVNLLKRSVGPLEITSPSQVAQRQGELRVAASAVSALGRIDSERARASLLGAMTHGDARVRANAVDAVARRWRREAGQESARRQLVTSIVELKGDPHHRVRASAIRCQLVADVAGESTAGMTGTESAVLPMLHDPRPMHRIAGMWLAERVVVEHPHAPWDGLAGVVAGMITGDEVEEVRRRARRCASRLLARSTGGWGAIGAQG